MLGFSDAKNSSVSKGETCADTTKVINCFADIIAMRHFEEGAATVSAMNSHIPVINAGDGSHSHPTQTLTDLLTIKREIGRFDNITIGFCGDLKFGRTVHSLIKALSRYEGVKVVLIAPEQLRLPDYMKQEVCDMHGVPYKEVDTMEEVMGELDVLYMTRVQKERYFDEDEYDRVKDGKFVRMALIVKLLEWANDPTKTTELVPKDAVRNKFICRNKRCISNMEVGVDSLFRPAHDHSGDYRCVYCESKPK